MSTYAQNSNNNDTIFEDYFAMDDINENVGLTNKIKPQLMLIEIFKEMTNHLEGHYIVDDINEVRAYLNYKNVEAKIRAEDNLNLSNIEEKGEFNSFTLPSSKKKKTYDTNIFNNYLDLKSSFNYRLNQSFNTIVIGLTYF